MNISSTVYDRSLKTYSRRPPNKEDIETMKNYKLIDFIEYWMKNVKYVSVKPATFLRLQVEADSLRPYPIAEMKISEIKLYHIQDYINQLVDAGYAYTTIAKQRLIVTAPLRYAYNIELLDRDCTGGVVMPHRELVKKDGQVVESLTEDEQEAILSVLRGDTRPISAIIEFMMETGLRVGEAQALQWSDVDMRKKCIHICKTVLNGKYESRNVVQQNPKTRSSVRTIPVSTRAIEILKEQNGLHSGNFVFSDSDEPMSYNRIRKRFQRVCDKAGLERHGLHVLRHTFATNCYHNGCDVKILSKLLGHASTSITYNTYINLYGDGLEEMRSVLR